MLPELSADIREIPRPARGFGSVRAHAQVGGSQWSSLIYPDSASGSYLLLTALKKKVRDAESLVGGSPVSVRLEVLDG